MLSRISQFATNTFLVWMLVAALLGFFISKSIIIIRWMGAIFTWYRNVRDGALH